MLRDAADPNVGRTLANIAALWRLARSRALARHRISRAYPRACAKYPVMRGEGAAKFTRHHTCVGDAAMWIYRGCNIARCTLR